MRPHFSSNRGTRPTITPALGERGRRQDDEHDPSKAQRETKATSANAEVGAASDPQQALRTAVANGCRSPEDFARFIERCPSMANAVIHALHQQFGNGYVQAVTM